MIRKTLPEVAAEFPDGSSVEDLSENIARAVNSKIIEHLTVGDATKIPSRTSLVNVSGVKDILLNHAKTASAAITLNNFVQTSNKSRSVTTSRNKYKKKVKLFPLSFEELLSGITHERGVQILRQLKGWKPGNCSLSKGLSTTVPKSKH